MSQDKKILSIPIKSIVRGENSRQTYNDIEMAELMVSMRQTGLLQPVGVKVLGKEKYKLVFGFRRFEGAVKLGWEFIDGVVVEAKTDEEEYIKNSIENIHRSAISYAEQGRIFAGLIKKGLTGNEIAARVGCNIRYVRAVLDAFHDVPKKFQHKIAAGLRGKAKQEGQITPRTAFEIIRIKKKSGLTSQQTEKLFQVAESKNVSADHLRVAGALLRSKVPMKAAVDKMEITRIIVLQLAMELPQISRLQTKYKKPIHAILYDYLMENKEFKGMPMRQKSLKSMGAKDE